MAVRSVLLGLLIAMVACRDRGEAPPSSPPSTQTFEEAMRIACDAPEQAELPSDESGEANRAMVLAVWLDRRVTNREVRQLMGGGDAQSPQGKLAALQSGARRAGITRCALAEMWQASSAPPGSAGGAESSASESPPPSEPQTGQR